MEILQMLYVAVWVALLLVPIVAVVGTFGLAHIYYSDQLRPRNRVLRTLYVNAVLAALSSSMLAVVAAIELLDHTTGGEQLLFRLPVLLAILLLIAVHTSPFRVYLALRAIGTTTDQTRRVETQDEREDRQFGVERRKLEEQHNKALDKK